MRSTKKAPYVDPKLLIKIVKHTEKGDKGAIKTWSRGSDVSPEMVGVTLAIHNGKVFKEVFINESMVGHKLGEFSPTRKFISHSRKGYEGPKKEGAAK